MGKRAVDVDKLIAVARGIPGLAPVADLAEIGRAVCEAIRAHGGLPRERKPRGKTNSKAGAPRVPRPAADVMGG